MLQVVFRPLGFRDAAHAPAENVYPVGARLAESYPVVQNFLEGERLFGQHNGATGDLAPTGRLEQSLQGILGGSRAIHDEVFCVAHQPEAVRAPRVRAKTLRRRRTECELKRYGLDEKPSEIGRAHV